MSSLMIINEIEYELTYIRKNNLTSFELYLEDNEDTVIRIFTHREIKIYITDHLSEKEKLILFKKIQKWLTSNSEKDLIIDISNNNVKIINS